MSVSVDFFGGVLPFVFPLILYVITLVLLFKPVPIVNFAIGGIDLLYVLFLAGSNEFFVMFAPIAQILLIVFAVLAIASGYICFSHD